MHKIISTLLNLHSRKRIYNIFPENGGNFIQAFICYMTQTQNILFNVIVPVTFASVDVDNAKHLQDKLTSVSDDTTSEAGPNAHESTETVNG